MSPKKPSGLWKGKEKATEADFQDLNPIITYRHLHSLNLGVKDPLRVIALCDSDAFYAACEQIRLALDPSIPLVVQQWDALIAVNYPARKFGISRMSKTKDALEKCPHLKVVHVATYKEGEAEPGYWDNPDTLTHKVSLDHYRRESWKVYHMFKEGLPSGEVEKASIDEAFIEFTRPVREEILRRYPYLAEVPPDAPDGKDSPLPPPPSISWDGLGTVIPVNPESPSETPEGEVSGEHNAMGATGDTEVGEPDESTTWHDVALSIAAEMMDRIRRDIHATLGYTTSAGIARNKFLAKLTASYRKPNSQSVLRNAAIPNYLKPMPFQKIRFLGGKLGRALAEEYDASTVGSLLTVSLDEMQKRFGEESIWVWEILRGIDRNEVKEKPPVTKSMLASKNLPKPVVQASQGYHWIRVLAAELALRLREARESIPALWPKSIVLHIRQDYDGLRSKQASFPFVREITVDSIAHAGDKLWKEILGGDGPKAAPLKITNISLAFSGIESMEMGQRSIEGFFQKPPSTSTTDAPPTGRQDSNAEEDDEKLATKRKRTDSLQAKLDRPPLPTAESAKEVGSEYLSFTCDRCGRSISLPDDAAIPSAQDDNMEGGRRSMQDEIKEALERLRREHADFHFAEDLQDEGSGPAERSVIRPRDSKVAKSPVKKKQKSQRKPDAGTKDTKGIAKFFVQKG